MSMKARDIAIVLRRFGRGPLVTEEMALEIAKLVFIREFGREDFELQQPLSIRDEGDTWVVQGSREYDYDSPRDNRAEGSAQMVDGRVLIEIAKDNAAILALTRSADLADPKPAPR